MSGLMEQPFVNCLCFGFKGKRCARRHKVRHEEVDAAASKELEAWEQSGKVYTLQLLAYLLYSFLNW